MFNEKFLSTLSLRRATDLVADNGDKAYDFYPRSPCGERPRTLPALPLPIEISIHALLAESDQTRICSTFRLNHFYPRSPCGERPPCKKTYPCGSLISIHALLAESDASRASRQQPAGISIHALLAESDKRRHKKHLISQVISIHALLAESDERAEHHANSQQEFLSTLSLRRATSADCNCRSARPDFYPRSPCGERLRH